MPTVKMRKLKITALKSDKKAVLQLLTQSGCFEVSKAEDIESDEYRTLDAGAVQKATQARVAFAIDYLKTLSDEAKELNKEITAAKDKSEFAELFNVSGKEGWTERLELGQKEYAAIREKESELFSVIEELEKSNSRREGLEQKIIGLKELNRELGAYKSIDMPFSKFADTRTVSVLLAIKQGGTADKSDLKKFECYIQEYPSEYSTLWGVLCKSEDKAVVLRKLKSLGFTLCPFDYDKTAAEVIAENRAEVKESEALIIEQFRNGLSYLDRLTELKTLYDVIGLDIEYTAAEANIFATDKTVTVEGWVPASAASAVEKRLRAEIKDAEVESRAVKLGDDPPSLSVSNKLTRPFESVTKGYGAPTYGEADPSPVMSIFFFIFFGIMLADAGYGLIMAVAGIGIGLFARRMETGLKRMVLMFGICGVSGVIFGLLFGGVFAIEGLPALWFNPMDDPVMMLIFSLALGAVHLLTGYTLKTIKVIRADVALSSDKKSGAARVFDGLFDSLFMYMLFGGILVLLLPMLFESSFPFTTVAAVMLVSALIGILFTGGRRAPGIGGKVAGGFGGLYKLINV